MHLDHHLQMLNLLIQVQSSSLLHFYSNCISFVLYPIIIKSLDWNILNFVTIDEAINGFLSSLDNNYSPEEFATSIYAVLVAVWSSMLKRYSALISLIKGSRIVISFFSIWLELSLRIWYIQSTKPSPPSEIGSFLIFKRLAVLLLNYFWRVDPTILQISLEWRVSLNLSKTSKTYFGFEVVCIL